MSTGLEPVRITGKALGILKDLPLWLLTGVTVSLLVFPFLPNADKLSSPLMLSWIQIAGILFGVLTFFRLLSVIIPLFSSWWMRRGRRQEQQDRLKRLYESRRYNKFYAPMFAELLAISITTATGTGAPRFTQRLENAWDKLCGIKRRSAAINAAWKALFDRQISDETGEVEYGERFPLEKLKRIVERNLAIADTELVDLIFAAERARLESHVQVNYLTKKDVQLYNYIMTEHNLLKELLFL